MVVKEEVFSPWSSVFGSRFIALMVQFLTTSQLLLSREVNILIS